MNVRALVLRALSSRQRITGSYLTKMKREFIEKEAFGSAPVASVPPPPAPAAEAIDAFGLPCDVSFAPRAAVAAKPVRGKAVRGPRTPRSAPLTPTGAAATADRGDDFVLGRVVRGPSSPPADVEVRMHAATVTPAMVGAVVRQRAAGLELCMLQLPRDSGATTVGLVLTIEPGGGVSAARVTGAPPASGFASCLATQARTWTFPHADAAVTIEYPVVVNAR